MQKSNLLCLAVVGKKIGSLLPAPSFELRAAVLTLLLAVAVTIPYALSPIPCHSVGPNFIAKQGQIRVADQPANGQKTMTFRLNTDATGSGTVVWSKTANVYCINGMFNYPLSIGDSDKKISDLDFANQQYYMSMQLEDGNEMLPREPLAALPYAFCASTATNLRGDGHIRITGAGDHYILNGNVGIGIVNPTYKLQVFGGALGTSLNNEVNLLKLHATSNNQNYLNVRYYRNTQGGADWMTGTTRIEQVVDSVKQAYIEFNPLGGNYALALGAGSGGVEYMRICSDGKVGIGTTDPGAYKLNVNGPANVTGNVNITGTITGNLTGNVTGNTSGSSGSCTGNAATATNATNHINDVTGAVHGATSANTANMIVRRDGSGNFTAGTVCGANGLSGVAFQVGNDVTIEDINVADTMAVYGTSAGGATTNVSMKLGRSGPTLTGGTFMGTACFWSSTAYNFYPGGGSWANWGGSDIRIKKNVATITGALDKISQLRGVSYEWKNPDVHSPGVKYGFIAQEIEKVFPNFIIEIEPLGKDKLLTEDGKVKTFSLPFDFDAYLVEAIKELKTENDGLKERVGELIGRIERLENK